MNGLTLIMELISRVGQEFSIFFPKCEAQKTIMKKILSHEWFEFSDYYIYFDICSCFFQILDTTCSTWRLIACYFQTVNKHLVFSQCKTKPAYENITFILLINPVFHGWKCNRLRHPVKCAYSKERLFIPLFFTTPVYRNSILFLLLSNEINVNSSIIKRVKKNNYQITTKTTPQP